MQTKKIIPFAAFFLLFIASCMKMAEKALVIQESPARAIQHAKNITEKIAINIADGLQIALWASDSLAPDPVAMSIDDFGSVYLTRTNRNRNSEFDIRGHQDWMTESIAMQSVEDHRAFLRKTFAPENSEKNIWLKDLNKDGVHDWHDLMVEKEEVWRLDDTNKDGYADKATVVLSDFNQEISDVAGGLLVRRNDAFVACAPDVWRLENKNKDGVWQKKTSISTGYQVHIGFGGHNLSGLVEGPDGRIYWNMGDIGANVTALDGSKHPNPNSGFIARSNPDGSDFEIFATGLRNTHEFVFDEYGNLISSDNDGDHPGESERLVHVVEGSDAGWRSNWQYGKYTDPKNNRYNVWMDEKLAVPHWDGQAAYILPPIMNYHNGPTGMLYNPGTALGNDWKNKFFLVEFVGSAARSHIWSFGLKQKGASFVLDGEKDMVSGILPTGIQFGPDGALYAADWINGWDTKNYGRVWKIDVTKDKNDLAAARLETKRRIQLDYTKQTPENLYQSLFYGDMRVRQKAQFELVTRGKAGLELLLKAISQTENQLARVHGIWGIGQMARKQHKDLGGILMFSLKDKDPEIVVQAIKMLGDAQLTHADDPLIQLLKHPNPRVQFYAAEGLGQIASRGAIYPLLDLLQANNDKDLYIRHACVLALARIGKVEPIVALANNPSKALRTAAVLVLRRMKNENIALFLKDQDEYIVTEAARGINDDLSIPTALPALAAILKEEKFTAEPLLRRAINAALRVHGAQEAEMLINFAKRTDISDEIKAEALATIGTWENPSVLDRVDGRFRGKISGNLAIISNKIEPHIANFLQEKNPKTLIAVAGLLSNLGLMNNSDQLAQVYTESKDNKVKIAALRALSILKYKSIEPLIKNGMEDADENVRTAALSLLSNATVSTQNLPAIVQSIFAKGSIKEQQQLLVVMRSFNANEIENIWEKLIGEMKDKKLSPDVMLELREAIGVSNSDKLKAQIASIQPEKSLMSEYADVLYGGDKQRGYWIFTYNGTAQCGRCHAVKGDGANVGPDLTHIGSQLTREQILQALIEPSVRIAPGYGNVTLKLKDGQEVFGVLIKETETALTLKTSNAEPLIIQTARIEKRENTPSSMPALGLELSKREVRDVVEYLTSLK